MNRSDPTKLSDHVESWFRRHQRRLPWRATYDPYHVWLSEIMLQQTRMEVVLTYYDRFLSRFPTVTELAAASEDEVVSHWSGLGYYRRARMLREGAIDVRDRFDGQIPSTLDDLLSIAGIGRYTAGAIASIAFEQHAPIVDGNVSRIVARVLDLDDPIGSPALTRAAWETATAWVGKSSSPRAFNQGLMELGALICKPQKPLCLLCPIREDCLAHARGRAELLPTKRKRPATRKIEVPLYLVIDGQGQVLMLRALGKLLGSMLHLPHGDTTLLGDTTPLAVRETKLLGTFPHTITNRRIEFRLFLATLPPMIRDSGERYLWIDPASLHDHPHPSYVAKALQLARSTGTLVEQS